MEDNSHAGQGAVLLDIGGTVGALVLSMPAALLGQEIEIRPVDGQPDPHPDATPHHHDATPHHHDTAPHRHYPHVAVLNRPRDGHHGDPTPTAVFAELEQGQYELYVLPDGQVSLTVTVRGGEVSYGTWPA